MIYKKNTKKENPNPKPIFFKGAAPPSLSADSSSSLSAVPSIFNPTAPTFCFPLDRIREVNLHPRPISSSPLNLHTVPHLLFLFQATTQSPSLLIFFSPTAADNKPSFSITESSPAAAPFFLGRLPTATEKQHPQSHQHRPYRQPQQRPQTSSLPHPPELPAFFNQQRRAAPRAAAPASSGSSSTDAVPHGRACNQQRTTKQRRRRNQEQSRSETETNRSVNQKEKN